MSIKQLAVSMRVTEETRYQEIRDSLSRDWMHFFNHSGLWPIPVPNMPEQVRDQVDDLQTRRMIAIVNSMTPQERNFPDVIRGSRKKRIASGSGTSIQDVNRMLKKYAQMQRMMKKFGKGGMNPAAMGGPADVPAAPPGGGMLPGLGGGAPLPPGLSGFGKKK